VGDRVYVAAEAGGLQVFSFADPTSPDNLASVSMPGSGNGVRVDPLTHLAFVAARDGGLVVVRPMAQYRVYLPIVQKQ
jgi:hypothetical protein